eukprot:1581517-Alexandrium_andersonii.AAC.1
MALAESAAAVPALPIGGPPLPPQPAAVPSSSLSGLGGAAAPGAGPGAEAEDLERRALRGAIARLGHHSAGSESMDEL